jgi:hypothetical protein
VAVPGVRPASVLAIEPKVPVAKWPQPGEFLPVAVDGRDPRYVRVLWDRV